MKQTNRSASDRPSVELMGNSRVLVWDCSAVLEYEPESVKLRAAKRTVRVNGSNLDLCRLDEGNVMIRGLVSSVEFED